MTSYLLLFFVLKKVFYLIVMFAVVFGVLIIVKIVTANIAYENNDDDKFKIAVKGVRKYSCILIIIIALLIFAPKHHEIISYMVVKEVDTYNISETNSRLHPQKVVKSADDVLRIIELSIGKVERMLNIEKEQDIKK